MLPPATPLPPRITAASFSSAAHAQSHIPLPYRRPTFHLVLLSTSSPFPVLRHAHHIQALLSAKGIHVFLQTELSLPPNNLVPITPAVIPDIAIHSTADFFAVVAETDLPSASLRVRLSPNADFVQLSIPDLLDAVFSAWARFLRTDRDLPSHVAPVLPTNPNIVTHNHLDFLLQTCSDVPHLRRSYNKLLRLVHFTSDWQAPPPPPSQLPQAPHTKLLKSALHASEAEGAEESSQGDDGNVQEASDARVATSDTESRNGSDEDANCAQSDAPDSSDNVTREGCTESEGGNANANSVNEELRPLCEQALRDGLRKVARKNHASNKQVKRKRRPRRDFSMCWLKRSDDMAARILRSQLLARSLHEDLMQTFDVVALMPVSGPVLHGDAHQEPGLPSETHRRRLLREVNDLLPRIEEVGRRLSKRPRGGQYGKVLLEANPWQAYVEQITSAAVNSDKRCNISGFVGEAARGDSEEGMKCSACGSYSSARFRECAVCSVRYTRTDEQWWAGKMDLFRKRFQDTINNAAGPPAPWVFAPVIPFHALVKNSYGNGIVGKESGRRKARGRSPVKDERRSGHGYESTHGVKQVRSVGQQQQNAYNLAAQFESMSVKDKYSSQVGRNGMHMGTGMGEAMGNRGTSSMHNSHSHNSGMTGSEGSVVMGSSPPNENLRIDFDANQRVANGRLHYRGSGLEMSGTKGEQKEITQRHFGISARTGAQAEMEEVSRREVSKSGFRRSQIQAMTGRGGGMESNALKELAIGSYEAAEDRQWMGNASRKNGSSSAEADVGAIDSLQALAAASDAANGGTGSATRESLLAVSALVSAPKAQRSSEGAEDVHGNGIYNMF